MKVLKKIGKTLGVSLLLLPLLSITLFAAPDAKDKSEESADKPSPTPVELERRIDILTEELQKLREQIALPEEKSLKGEYGLGPAAAKIYTQASRLAFGGYGEFNFDFTVKDIGDNVNEADFLRYVQYIGYKFTDRLLFNSEIEFEHATTSANFSGDEGSVSVEFAYLEFLWHRFLNLRAGLLLIPVGFINELHEPPFFFGNVRPEVERRIIPTTWRELGVGIHGELAEGLDYRLYVVNGFNGLDFTDQGWRGGRQKGNRAIIEDFAVTGRLDYQYNPHLLVGGSFHYGGADQEQIAGVDVNTLLTEGHVEFRWQGLELRGLAAYGSVSNAAALTVAALPDTTPPTAAETRIIASRVFGWYSEAGYDVWPHLGSSSLPFKLKPFVRFEHFDTQADTPVIAGRTANQAREVYLVDAGIQFHPHSQVVIKLNYRDVWNEADTEMVDSFIVGAGFVY